MALTVSSSRLRPLYLVLWNSARRSVASPLALSSLAPSSKLRLFSGGVLEPRVVVPRRRRPRVLNEVPVEVIEWQRRGLASRPKRWFRQRVGAPALGSELAQVGSRRRIGAVLPSKRSQRRPASSFQSGATCSRSRTQCARQGVGPVAALLEHAAIVDPGAVVGRAHRRVRLGGLAAGRVGGGVDSCRC